MCCAWSCDESKIAVGSSSKCISICYYDEKEDWWVPKGIKHHNSTVTGVSWNPTNPTLLASVSTDNMMRILSAYNPRLDSKSHSQGEFGTVLYKFDLGSWGTNVAWSPSGRYVAACSHNSMLFFYDMKQKSEFRLRLSTLSARSIGFISDSLLIIGGYMRKLIAVTRNNNNEWVISGKIEQSRVPMKKSHRTVNNLHSILRKFETKGDENEIKEIHKNDVTSIVVFSGGKGFSSAGADGRVVVWDLAKITNPPLKQYQTGI